MAAIGHVGANQLSRTSSLSWIRVVGLQCGTLISHHAITCEERKSPIQHKHHHNAVYNKGPYILARTARMPDSDGRKICTSHNRL